MTNMDMDDEIADLLASQRDRAIAQVQALEAECSNLRRMAAIGEALCDLQHELGRLMKTPCPSMAFGFGPEDTARAVTSEVEEIMAEQPGSDAAKRECSGLLAATMRMAMIQGADPAACMRQEADRIKGRLDTMARLGCSWAAAKTIESNPLLERLWVAVTMEAVTSDIAAWFAPGEPLVAVVMPRAPLPDRARLLVSDCFSDVGGARVAPLFGAYAWSESIRLATSTGCTVAVRDGEGPRFVRASK